MPNAFPPRATAAPWMPDAWHAPEEPVRARAAASRPATRSTAGAAGDFVDGWAVPQATPAATPAADALDGLDALLPDFAAVATGHGGARGEHGLAAVIAQAADDREGLVRAELAEAYAAELAALDAAHADALERAWAEGHAVGRSEGEADAQAALADATGALDAAVREIRIHEERWTGDLRAHVAALAVAVAQHVVGREVAQDDALVVALASRAVAEFPTQEALVARVHPDDLPALKAAWEDAPRAGDLRWTPDARVVRGGALVEGRERIVDGRVDMALERLYRALAGQAA